MKITKKQLRRLIKEEMQVGIDMLNWNELQVGDLVDVDAEFNTYPRTRIIQKLDDVSRESALGSGPGFIGTSEHGDEFVFSVQDVIPASYEKYALAEGHKLVELWGKKKEVPKRSTNWKESVADELENAIRLMSDGENAVMRAVWGLNDNPPDSELLKLGQAFMKRLRTVAEEWREAEPRDQE